jgi:capsular polysaccharide export protein
VDARGLADHVEREAPLASLLAQVDGVHVICSLAGFEALLRGVPVTVHGVPFYAGWGLTRDLAPVPRGGGGWGWMSWWRGFCCSIRVMSIR